MAGLDWSQCPDVESIPGKVSGAWVLKGSRMPVAAIFENLEAGANIGFLELSTAAAGAFRTTNVHLIGSSPADSNRRPKRLASRLRDAVDGLQNLRHDLIGIAL